MSNLVPFPSWKADATPSERLHELGHMAEAKPERFSQVAVVYTEKTEGGGTTVRYISSALNTLELLGLLRLAEVEVLRVTKD